MKAVLSQNVTKMVQMVEKMRVKLNGGIKGPNLVKLGGNTGERQKNALTVD